MNARVLLSAGALALLGCDPLMAVVGVVRSAPPCDGAAPPAGDAAPVSGARIVYTCPEPGWVNQLLGTTDASGHVFYRDAGLMGDACFIVVSREGYEPRKYRVRDVCAVPTSGMWGTGACHAVNVSVDLVPAGRGERARRREE